MLQVEEFVLSVERESDAKVYGGDVKAPKILADIVESVAAAIYIDLEFDLQAMWMIFRDFLEPIITLDVLEQQTQPVTMLIQLCQMRGKQADIKHQREGEMNVVSIYIDGQFVASASSDKKETAKFHAAKAALGKLLFGNNDSTLISIFCDQNAENEIEEAKHKLYAICGKKKWSLPEYRLMKESGRDNGKRFIYSVEVETSRGKLLKTGEP